LIDPSKAGVPSGSAGARLFLTALTGLNVSMLGVPAILNGVNLNAQVFLEILHTSETSDVP
jgi:hypothetical protein